MRSVNINKIQEDIHLQYSNMLPLSSCPVFSTFVIVLLVIIIKQCIKSRASMQKLPPGPPKLPLIGNLHQLIGSLLLPHLALTNLAKKYGSVMHLKLGDQDAIIISSSEAAKEVLKTNELIFAQRPILHAVEIFTYDYSSMVFAPYGDYWRKMRKICVTELLSGKRVESFRLIREEEAWNLIEFISSHDGVAMNLSEKIYCLTSNVTGRAAFNKKRNDGQGAMIMPLLSEGIPALGGFSLPDLYPSYRILRYITGKQSALERIQKKVDKILDDIINEHKDKSKFASTNSGSPVHEDVLGVLLNLQESNQLDIQLTDSNIKALTLDLFTGGSVTSAATMEWAMSELIRNPRVMEKAQAEVRQAFKGKTKIEEADLQSLDYLKLVMKEAFRIRPTGVLIPREAREKCEISGYEIPAKAKVFINFWAITRDPNVWKEPECFNPERFQGSEVDFRGTNYEFIPFGAGRRMCPGISFANAVIELALAQMLYHFDWKLPDGIKPEELDMSESFGINTRKKHSLHLVPTICVPFNRTG